MEMGTGKTRTVLELIARKQAKISNVVWFCPVSIKYAIAEEIAIHVYHQKLLHIFNDKTLPENIPHARIHIVGLESVSGSVKTIFCLHKIIRSDSYIVIDESFYIKNPSAKRTIWITELTKNCLYKSVLTGTPIAHSVIDLYAQIKFLSSKIFGYRSYYEFSKNHIRFIEEKWGYSQHACNTEYLAAKLEPYVYQVTKDKCLDLPDKIYQPHYFEMSYEQREAYNRSKDDFLFNITDIDNFQGTNILQLFTTLQQIVCGFNNAENEYYENNRLKALQDVLNYIPAKKKIIIFCKYLEDIENIQTIIANRQETFSPFHGGMSEIEKRDSLKAFRENNKYFLTTFGSGGHGLTLNEAEYTIFYNNNFKYTDRIQAEDRNYRIGQMRPPNYIDIICRDSIDEKIERSFQLKDNAVDVFKKQIQTANTESKRKILDEL